MAGLEFIDSTKKNSVFTWLISFFLEISTVAEIKIENRRVCF